MFLDKPEMRKYSKLLEMSNIYRANSENAGNFQKQWTPDFSFNLVLHVATVEQFSVESWKSWSIMIS